jgi:hypothetical protein
LCRKVRLNANGGHQKEIVKESRVETLEDKAEKRENAQFVCTVNRKCSYIPFFNDLLFTGSKVWL